MNLDVHSGGVFLPAKLGTGDRRTACAASGERVYWKQFRVYPAWNLVRKLQGRGIGALRLRRRDSDRRNRGRSQLK